MSLSQFTVLAPASRIFLAPPPSGGASIAPALLGELGAAALIIGGAAVAWALWQQRVARIRRAELEMKNAQLERESAERRQTLETLLLTEQRLRMAMEAAELRTWHWDIAADRFELVGEWHPELGPPPPPAGSAMDKFLAPVHPDDIGAVTDALRRARETGEPLSIQFRMVVPGAGIRWKVARGCGVRNARGAVTSLIGVVLDVTDRVRSVEELRRSEERYRELFENANDIVYIHDLSGRFTSINKAAERLLGYSAEEVLQLDVRDVVAPGHVDVAERMIARKVAGDVSGTEYELDVRAKDGRMITLEVNTRLVRHDGRIVGVQGIARDVTERKRLERQLAQSQKMEAVGQLAGGIAHDFNNLLTAILGNTQLAQIEGMEPAERAECLREIAAASHRAAALTRQLLVFSRQEPIDRRPVRLSESLGDFMNMLRRIIGEHIEVSLSVAHDLPAVMADPAQIEQVVLNLAVNARDAMPQGGRLAIDLDHITLDAQHGPAASPVPAGRYVRLRIADSGAGIMPDVRQRIFEPFFTTKAVGAGTGLGLAVVYGIVRQHDGFIDVASAPAAGTCFTVYLPAIETHATSDERPAASPVAGGRETILVAEDEVALRRLAARLLAGLGYTVLVARDGDEALQIYLERRGEIDLLLLDIVMPKRSGPDVHAAVRQAGGDVPIVFMTGYSAEVMPHEPGSDTGCRILYKPYDLDALGSVVRDVLEGAGV